MAGRGRRIIYSKKMYSFEMEEKKKRERERRKLRGRSGECRRGGR